MDCEKSAIFANSEIVTGRDRTPEDAIQYTHSIRLTSGHRCWRSTIAGPDDAWRIGLFFDRRGGEGRLQAWWSRCRWSGVETIIEKRRVSIARSAIVLRCNSLRSGRRDPIASAPEWSRRCAPPPLRFGPSGDNSSAPARSCRYGGQRELPAESTELAEPRARPRS